MTDSAPHAACENCATPLQGPYCHVCSQHAHNPLNSFGHAAEEFAESFWHLDGRVFRTLRDLLVPGRIINAYLSGHRVPYMPPLRLFVILAVLAFFVAQYAFHLRINDDKSAFAQDTTVAQVEQRRDAELAKLEAARIEMEKDPHAKLGAPGMLAGEAAVRESAAQRIAELQGKPAVTDTDDASASSIDADEPAAPATHANAASETPTHVTWLPGFANRWLGHRIAMGQRNIDVLKRNPDAFTHALIHSVPTALFVLVPLFALLLKLFYWRSGRGYLQHLIAALYSHAFLCLALTLIFALQILGQHVPATVGVLGKLQTLLWLWMAAYLWWTQFRVYAQSIGKTTLKYLLLGGVYFWMVMFAAIVLILLNISRG